MNADRPWIKASHMALREARFLLRIAKVWTTTEFGRQTLIGNNPSIGLTKNHRS
jgi:hypothetical protein